MSTGLLDPNTICCVVVYRLDRGELPQKILRELRTEHTSDISSARVVMKILDPKKYPERRTNGLTRGTLHQFLRRTGTDGR